MRIVAIRMQIQVPKEIRRLQPKMELVGESLISPQHVLGMENNVIVSMSAIIPLHPISNMEIRVTSTPIFKMVRLRGKYLLLVVLKCQYQIT